jgi:lysophospholipase L1-like esterase
MRMKQIYWLRVIIIMLLLLLVVAIAAAYIAFTFAQIFARNENAVRLDPFALAAFQGAPTPRASDLKRVVFYGDSRAEVWVAPDLSGWEFINRGIGGQTTAQVLGRFAAHIAPLKPQVIVLQVGINDLRTIPMFPESRASIIANCLTNIQSIIQQSTDLGADVILTTIFPVTEATFERRIFYWSDDIARAATEVNQSLRALASEHVHILDADRILMNTDGLARREYMEDTLHLNAAGYEALNQRLVELLNKVRS